jgi:hypothetical protein
MTNEVYQVRWLTGSGDGEAAAGEYRKVLMRVYGEGVELFFDREDEVRTFECMSRHGHGPRLLGRFPTGRVEEFIHARVRSFRLPFLFLFLSCLLCNPAAVCFSGGDRSCFPRPQFFPRPTFLGFFFLEESFISY